MEGAYGVPIFELRDFNHLPGDDANLLDEMVAGLDTFVVRPSASAMEADSGLLTASWSLIEGGALGGMVGGGSYEEGGQPFAATCQGTYSMPWASATAG